MSARLDAILSLLLPCAQLADVGTDHGLLPIAAVQRGIAQRAIAADLRVLPLAGARKNIARAGVSETVLALQGDGLEPLRDRAVDAVTMAGMSGELMVRLLSATPSVLSSLTQLVLQPNQDVQQVRAWASGHAFHLRDERMVEERGYFFPTCAFGRASGADPAYAGADFDLHEQYQLGPMLIARRDATARRAWEEQRARLAPLVAQGVTGRADELALFARACALR